MRPLIIGPDQVEAIAACIKEAEAKPITRAELERWAVADLPDDRRLTLADRKKGHDRPVMPFVFLPVGYRVHLSIEEQPPGLCKHLSISVDMKGALPHPEAVKMIAKEFGIDWDYVLKGWVEEWEPGHDAVNLLALHREGTLQ